jgi:hypothetical protein
VRRPLGPARLSRGIELNAPAHHVHKRAAEVGAVTGLECLLEARHAAIDRSYKRGAGTLGSGGRGELGAIDSKEKPQE